jgi:phosphoglycerate dehydrogenase-like enzyme
MRTRGLLQRRAAAVILGALLAAAGVAGGAETVAPAASAADSLGLQPSAQPVRARAGWRPPRIILVDAELHAVLAQLQPSAPGVKFIEISAATAREVAAADATLGVCSATVLEKATRLVWIQWLAAGVEECTRQPLLHQRRPLLTNMQRVAAPSMAEHVLGMMLALSHRLDYFMRQQQQAHWDEDPPPLADLEGKTVLVVGLGGIGTEVARRAHALGMRVIATRASSRAGPDYVSYVGLPEELPKLTREADFVVNCTPLTPQTTGIFDRSFFATMKPGAYFLSVGRGRSTVTADLAAALSSGQIAGAALDVVDPEPLPAEHPLWHLPNLIITPHISGNTPVSDEQRLTLLRENLRRYVAGDPMLAVVDIERGY